MNDGYASLLSKYLTSSPCKTCEAGFKLEHMADGCRTNAGNATQ
jgi:hypothetical protein